MPSIQRRVPTQIDKVFACTVVVIFGVVIPLRVWNVTAAVALSSLLLVLVVRQLRSRVLSLPRAVILFSVPLLTFVEWVTGWRLSLVGIGIFALIGAEIVASKTVELDAPTKLLRRSSGSTSGDVALGVFIGLVASAVLVIYLGAQGLIVPAGVLPHGVVLAVGIPAFAVANAAIEELLWRFVLMDFMVVFECGWFVGTVVSSTSFAIAHYFGIPSGPLGVALAFCFGIVLSICRRMRHGLRAGFVGHVVVDVAVGLALLR